MVDIIEHGVEGQRIAQVHADRLIDGARARVALLHFALHHLELFGGAEGGVELDARGGRELDDRILREILHAAADVAAPFVHHGAGGQIAGHEGQLVEPAGDVALHVHIAAGLAGAHGDAQNAVLAKAHGAGQRGHVAVVAYGQRHVADFLRGADIDVLDILLVVLRSHLEEQRGAHGVVVDVHARAAHADGVHAGHLGGGGLHGANDAVKVIGRVGLGLGEPDDLLAVDAFAVDDGGYFAVASARIKADAAAVQVAADGRGGVLAGRGLGGRGGIAYLKGMLINVRHEIRVKGARATLAVLRLHTLVYGFAARDGHAEAAVYPQHALDHAFHHAQAQRVVLALREDAHVMRSHQAVVAFHGNADFRALRRARGKGLQPPVDGLKRRVQWRQYLHLLHFSCLPILHK